MSLHGHPTATEKHEAAALERVLRHRPLLRDLAEHERQVRAKERRRIVDVFVQDNVETDFEGCVG